MFLCRELNLPSGDGLMGVRKAGIALLCHMDRLGAPLLPPLKGFVTVSTHLSFMFYTHPQGEMKVICIAIKMYTVHFHSILLNKGMHLAHSM